MTEREQQHLCRWNRELVRANSHLHHELSQLRPDMEELNDTNANLQAQLDVADALLGTAIDEALRARRT